MRRVVSTGKAPVQIQPSKPVIIPHDSVTESIIIAAAVADPEALKTLVRKIRPDHFIVREHAEAWTALTELSRRGLACDASALETFGGTAVAAYVESIASLRPEKPSNLDWHVANLFWDSARANAARGPLPAFLEALRNPKEEPDKVRSLARAVAASFDGYQDRRHLHDQTQIVRDQMLEIERRAAGHACYPYGIEGLDWYDKLIGGERRMRMLPGAAPGQISVVTGISGSGKALAIDTPIATPYGWTTMGELGWGDEVFDEKGNPCRVTRTTGVMLDRECYEIIFSDGERIIADADHLWLTQTAAERRASRLRTPEFREQRRQKRGYQTRRENVSASLFQTLKSRELVSVGGSVRTTLEIANTLRYRSKGREELNHSIVLTETLVLPDENLLLPPYLVGVWLGDGHSACGRITKPDEEIFDKIRTFGYEVGPVDSAGARTVYTMVAGLRALNILNNKHIPAMYLRGSVEQRLELLRGLMDTDGTCNKSGHCEFDTTTPGIRDGIAELLASLGIKAQANERRAKLYGVDKGPSWRFHFTTDLRVFSLKRKAVLQCVPARAGMERKRYILDARRVASVPVRCIQVDSPSKLFLAGRKMVPTHNSTITAHLALGLAYQGRRVLYGAWEMSGGVTLEILACISLGWSRTDLMEARGPIATHEGRIQFEERMHVISKRIRFMGNPFRRARGEKFNKDTANDRNLDIVQGYISDTGCDVLIADLWKRCLRNDEPSAEEDALVRQQAMAEETRCHCILLQQQRLKDIEQRPDKRPTREGIKGTGAWVEVADTILGLHRPALWKRMDDNRLEVIVLKQRFGKWPLAVEFDWEPDSGGVSGGKSIDYDRPGEGNDTDDFLAQGHRGNKKKWA